MAARAATSATSRSASTAGSRSVSRDRDGFNRCVSELAIRSLLAGELPALDADANAQSRGGCDAVAACSTMRTATRRAFATDSPVLSFDAIAAQRAARRRWTVALALREATAAGHSNVAAAGGALAAAAIASS